MIAGQISHYLIINKLGAGGMGEVYLAEDTRLGRKVALKLLPAEFTKYPDRVRRFAQEAKAASALNHPNIITIHEIGIEDGAHYIATEFIDGQTLREHLKGARLALPAALDIAVQAAAALAAAHEAGIVHRDIKPENVMVRRDGIVKVLDFGLAKLTELRIADRALRIEEDAETLIQNQQASPQPANPQSAIRNPQLTDPGTVMGTASYMSPEQARGQEVDARSDIFSLGVLLYEMVAGQAPFAGVNALEVISEILKSEPAPLGAHAPNLAETPPAELQRIVSKALRKNRDERYPTSRELLADLKDLKRDLDFIAEERRRSRTAAISEQGLAQSETSGLQQAPGEPGAGPPIVDIAHVLFCDIVGYSILPIDRQKQMISALQEIVRQTEDYRRADSRGQLVRLPAGDGMALAFLQDPVAPVRCAFDIARALQSYPEIGLRMGIHSGPVFLSTDINGNRNVVGSGINMAQRVMDSGDAGHILVSRNVAEVLSQVSYWQPLLRDLGEREVKHGARIHLYNVYTDEIGNATLPTKLQTAPSLSDVSEGGAPSAPVISTTSVRDPASAGYSETPSRYRSSPRTGACTSIAILPFVNMSADPENEYFCDGLAEELLNALSKIENLKVAARTSAFSFKGKSVNVSEIGEALGVKTALEGSVRKSGNRLRITAQLINVSDGYHLWSERYDRLMEDIFDVQDEIALAIVGALKVKLLGEEKSAVLKRHTDSTEAYELYLKGLYHFNKDTVEGWLKSIEYFGKAIEKEPEYALAYAGMGSCYATLHIFGLAPPQEIIPKWKAVASRALTLDDRLSEGHFTRAGIFLWHEWNWEEAERECKRAVELNPNSALARQYYGFLLASRERFDEAINEEKRALELDPLSLLAQLHLGWVYLFADRLDDALDQVRRMIEMEPNFPSAYWLMGSVYVAKGQYEEAIAAYQKSLALGGPPTTLSKLGCAYALAGRRGEALGALDQLLEMRERQYAAAFNIARVYAGLGDNDNAFAWLEKAFEERNGEMVFLKRLTTVGTGESWGKGFRNDPRYGDALRRIGLAL